MFKYFAVIICLLAVFGMSTRSYAQEPLVKIEGEVPEELTKVLYLVIGEVDKNPRSYAQARRQAEAGAKKAKSTLRSQGYYGADIQARIDEIGSVKEKVSLQPILLIQPGAQFSFKDVTISYQKAQPNSELNPMKVINDSKALANGQPAIAANIVAAEAKIVNYLRANGYPDVRALPRKAIVDHNTQIMDVDYLISTGQRVRFGDVSLKGSAKIRPSFINDITPFKTNDLYDGKSLNALSGRLSSTGDFVSANAVFEDAYNGVVNADGTVTRNVLLNVEQGKQNTISSELGLSTTDGSGIDIVYERRNFAGGAETLKLIATAKTNQLALGATYNIPYLWRADRSLDISGDIAREDTDAFRGERASLMAFVSQDISSHLRAGLGLGLEASQFTEDDEDVTALLVEGRGRLAYDTRSSILDPVSGIYVEVDIVPSFNLGSEDGAFTALELGVSGSQRVSKTLITASRVKIGSIISDNLETIPLNRRFFGGGGGAVRGFGFQSISPLNESDELIGGQSTTEASAELRYRGNSPFGAAIFADAGNVSLDQRPGLSDMRYGAGVGLRYYTGFAPLRADIAIPLNKRDGDADFQVYISIGQAF